MLSSTEKQNIGVVGAGTMGRGIVRLFAQAGHVVRCFDTVQGAAAKALESISETLTRNVEKGRLTPEELVAVRGRIRACENISDLAGCEIIIEAITEDLDVKLRLFRELETIVAAAAILASNTSSLTVSEIAAACSKPGRVAGLHFFNPAPIMKVVEVVAAVRTAPEVVETLRSLIESVGHRAVVVADQPGFLVNHAGRGLYTEGLRLLEEQVADPGDIDAVLRDAAGFRMGPFELLDLTGLDVSSKVMTSIYEQFQHEPRYRPSSLVPPRVAAGLFGRKSGCGWYRYDSAAPASPSVQPPPAFPRGLKVWVDPDASRAQLITALARAADVEIVAGAVGADLTIVQPWGIDATNFAVEHGLDPERCVAVDPLPEFGVRRTLMLTVATSGAARDAAHALLASDGAAVTLINDSPGFIVQRVLATIVNIACHIVQRGIGSVADIEDAVRLGLGYPLGPLAWGDKIGGDRVLEVLRAMHAATGDPRYRPSPWLVRRAGLGLSLLTAEARRHD
jgi:3-hydroxybutyryl-CoA dehydrogenase